VLALALAAGAAACSGGGSHGTGGATPTTSATATGAEGLPSAADLKSALLTSHDIGLPSVPPSPSSGTTAATGTGGYGITGCAPLAALLTEPLPSTTSAGQVEQDVVFSGGGAGPFVAEALTAEAPDRLAADYAKADKALAACRSVTFTSGTTRLTFELTPIMFGGPGSSGARMDSTYEGVQVNGYLAFQRIGPVIMAYYFFQVGGGSSQLAAAYYRQAADKADRVLGAQAS
jgi:hypothetical protein